MRFPSDAPAAEPPPEITKIRLLRNPAICFAPLYMSEELLRGEGFTDIQFVQGTGGGDDEKQLAAGTVDFAAGFVGRVIVSLDAGDPLVILLGLHIGCYDVFGTNRIRSIRDLKGKRVAVGVLTSGRHIFVSVIAANVGLDPRKDINWVTEPPSKAIELFAESKVDAFMAFPPEPVELREKKIGHVLVNTTIDRPWSQYFCCMITSNREFVRRHPVATKRALRAFMKANSICATDPERTSRLLVDKGYAKRHDSALQSLKEIPYAKWREYDPEDTLRFYSLRLYEAGMIKNNPQKLISRGTDWRFIRQLRNELKA